MNPVDAATALAAQPIPAKAHTGVDGLDDILAGGLNRGRVFPRLVSSEYEPDFSRDVVRSNSPELDALLGGGIERGSSTLVLGPAGTGKSLLTLTFAAAAVARGEKAAMFVFDEEEGLLIERAKGLGIDMAQMVAGGNLILRQIDAAELAPGEFAHRVKHIVEIEGARTVIVDSLNGHQAAMPEERSLVLHMQELAAISEPPWRQHFPDRRPARPGRRHEGPGRRHLPCRHGDPADPVHAPTEAPTA